MTIKYKIPAFNIVAYIHDRMERLTVNQIMNGLEYSEVTVRNTIRFLLDNKLVEKNAGRPVEYMLTLSGHVLAQHIKKIYFLLSGEYLLPLKENNVYAREDNSTRDGQA